MQEKYKDIGYKVSENSDLMNDEFGITPDLSRQMEMLHRKAEKGGKKNIDFLLHKIEQYPNVPQLKNYLSVAYMNSGNREKSFEVNNWILKEHPGYLFGILNKANEYYITGEYEKMPDLMGKTMKLQDLYTDRNEFHLLEVISFYKAAVLYFSAIGDFKEAESRYEIMKELAPEHPENDVAYRAIIGGRMKAAGEQFEREEAARITPDFGEYDKSVQTKEAPVFENVLIKELYNWEKNIDPNILEKILALPRESLIRDLRKVIADAINRFEYFLNIDPEYGHVFFPTHAIFLLGELEAVEALDDILNSFKQGEEFCTFWYDEFLSDGFWEPLLKLSKDKLEVLTDFMIEPSVYTYAKSEVSVVFTQISYHYPEKRKQVKDCYEIILNQFLNRDVENLVDSDLLGMITCELMEVNLHELLPLLEDLFEKGYVGDHICGSFEDVKKDFGKVSLCEGKKEVLGIIYRYNKILSGGIKPPADFVGFNHDLEDEFDYNEDITYRREELKVGRNDPCPCGSGKKYKKCCLND